MRTVSRLFIAFTLCIISIASWAQSITLTQSSTSRKMLFLMVDSSDHVTGKTALTPTVTLSKNGGAFGAPAGTVAELANGWYVLSPTSADDGTLGDLILHATAAGADPTDRSYNVVAVNPDDAAGFGLSRLDASISSRLSAASAPANWSAMVISSGGIVSSLVTGYSSGQDPATLVLAATVDGSLTVKQSHALAIAVLTGKYSIARDTVAKTITVTYKRFDGTTLLATLVTSYSDTGLTLATGRTITYSNLP